MTTQIANKDLVLEKIPNPEGESSDYQETWEKFALTMNGYEVCGDFESCSDLASQVIKEPKNASFRGKTLRLYCPSFSRLIIKNQINSAIRSPFRALWMFVP